MSQPAAAPDPVRVAATNPRTWLWLILVTSSLVRIAAIAHSFFWADDFVHIWGAWREPLGEFVLQEYNGHVEPLGMLVFWVMTRAAPQAWGPAMVYLCLLAVALPIAFWSVARRLMGDGWRTTATVAVFCAWPATLMAQTWLAAGVQATAFVFVLLAVRVYLGDHRMRVPLLVLLLVVASLFYQRALALPLLLMVIAVLRALGPPLTRLRAVLRAERGLWLALWAVALAGLGLGVYVAAGQESAGGDLNVANVAQGAWYGLVPGLLQSLAGMMWDWGEARTTLPEPMPMWLLVLLLLAVGFLIAVGWARDRAQTVCAVGSVLLMLAVEVAPVILVRTDFIGPSITMDPRLNTLSGITAILAVSSFFWDRATRPDRPAQEGDGTQPGPQPPARRALAPAVITVIVLGGLLSMGSYLTNMDGRRSSLWFAQVRGTIAALPEETVYAAVDSPAYMLDPTWSVETDAGYEQSIGTIRTLLDVGPDAPRFNTPTDRATTFNGFGDQGLASVDIRSAAPEGEPGQCPRPTLNGSAQVAMPEVVLSNPVLQIEYETATGGPARITSGPDAFQVQLEPGRHDLQVFPSAGPFSGFTLELDDPTLAACIRAASAGAPYAD